MASVPAFSALLFFLYPFVIHVVRQLMARPVGAECARQLRIDEATQRRLKVHEPTISNNRTSEGRYFFFINGGQRLAVLDGQRGGLVCQLSKVKTFFKCRSWEVCQFRPEASLNIKGRTCPKIAENQTQGT